MSAESETIEYKKSLTALKEGLISIVAILTTDSATIIDRHDFDGDMLELIEEAQKYILKNIHIGMRLKGLYRKDVPEIPAKPCGKRLSMPSFIEITVSAIQSILMDSQFVIPA